MLYTRRVSGHEPARTDISARAVALWAAPIIALVALATLLGTIGHEPTPDPLMALGLIVLGASGPVLIVGALLLASLGYGSVFRRAYDDSPEAWTIQLTLGLALLITITLSVGTLGLLIAPVSIGVVLLGLGLLARQVMARERGAWSGARVSRLWWLALPSGAVLLVAALSPPGWLWDSEFGAFDVLSYHLRLPQEWLASGRIGASEHNVYSYLPSGIEGVYALIGSMTLAPTDGAGGDSGLLAGSGWRAIGAQALHASMALVSAWTIGAFVRRALTRAEVDAVHAGRCAAIAGVVFLATPWTVVVGSLAYNEMGVTALGAGAMLVAIEGRIRPLWRGGLCAVLVGGACAAKPTAIFFVAPVVGVLLLGTAPLKEWARILVPGVVVGILMLAPWTARNAVSAGNPVFPQMTGVFGSAHWTEEQVERYQGAHRFEGGLAARAQTLLWTSPDSSEEDPSVKRWRGAINPQFGVIFPAALLAGIIALFARPTRRVAALLLLGLGAQAIAWMMLTHLQSRFLVPSLLPGAALLGLALGGVRLRRSRGPLLTAWVIVIAAQSVMTIRIFASQRSGRPNFGLFGGVGMMRGEPYDPEVGRADPTAFINHELPEGSRIAMVGASTALYITHDTLVWTTWDASPLGDAMGDAQDDVNAWTRALVERDATHALVDLGEIRRLRRSGWIDPRLTPERVSRWLESLGEPIQTWASGGRTRQILYRLGE